MWGAAVLHSSETGTFHFTMAVLSMLTGLLYASGFIFCFLALPSASVSGEIAFYFGWATTCFAGVTLCCIAMRAWWQESARTAAFVSSVIAIASAIFLAFITST